MILLSRGREVSREVSRIGAKDRISMRTVVRIGVPFKVLFYRVPYYCGIHKGELISENYA